MCHQHQSLTACQPDRPDLPGQLLGPHRHARRRVHTCGVHIAPQSTDGRIDSLPVIVTQRADPKSVKPQQTMMQHDNVPHE
jgi:hypothetical protein